MKRVMLSIVFLTCAGAEVPQARASTHQTRAASAAAVEAAVRASPERLAAVFQRASFPLPDLFELGPDGPGFKVNALSDLVLESVEWTVSGYRAHLRATYTERYARNPWTGQFETRSVFVTSEVSVNAEGDPAGAN